MICFNCGKNNVKSNSIYGMVYCTKCIEKQRKYAVKEAVEITTDVIKEERKAYSDDILQRYRGDTANKRYIKKYGKTGFTEEQIKGAKDVYPGFYKDE